MLQGLTNQQIQLKLYLLLKVALKKQKTLNEEMEEF